MSLKSKKFILWFKEISHKDVPFVGGKNASLGEMYNSLSKKGVNIPDGFATTSFAFWHFMKKTGLKEKIKEILKDLDVSDIKNLQEKGKKVRDLILKSKIPGDLEKEILKSYHKLSRKYGEDFTDVAVRTSATAEDLPEASFAGQYWTYLNVKGDEELLKAVKGCLASLFTDRAIFYRAQHNFSQLKIALSVGIQKMVRSDLACSGVMFSLDTESGFKDVVLINGSYGLGEMIVQGEVTPDEFYVFKPTLKKGFQAIISKNLGRKDKKFVYDKKGGIKKVETSEKEQKNFCLTNSEILTLAKWACLIEEHYSKEAKKWLPMDMEWAKDGKTGQLFIVQARPETVHTKEKERYYQEYRIETKKKPILTGIAVGDKIAQGKVHKILHPSKLKEFKKGEILVTRMTNPDWVPAMKMAKAIVTDEGGRSCFTGDTEILTDRGIMPIKDIVENYKRENFRVLSLNEKTLTLEWKRITSRMKRKSKVIEIDISQTGRMNGNTLTVTPDHKFLTFRNRELIREEIQKLIEKGEYCLSLYRIPLPRRIINNNRLISPEECYLLGAIFTDGTIYLEKSHGQVSFIQKETAEKSAFIERIKECMKNVFGYSLHRREKKVSQGVIRGKPVIGSATSFTCYRKSIAKHFKERERDFPEKVLNLPEEHLYNFLAGVIDGDGTYNETSNRINIFCSKNYLFKAIILICLRLGINFQVCPNRSVWNIQIVDKIPRILKYTHRVKGKYARVRFGVRFFSARQLLGDIVKRVNYKGRMILYVKNNLLLDSEKIRNYIIPMIKGSLENHSLTKIINSPLKMLRVKLNHQKGVKEVYNIEVEDNHNYVVFTKRGTPLIVSNCHAAIISRELGIPCVVGTEKATQLLDNGQEITVDCSEGLKGKIFAGKIPFKVKKYNLKKIPKLKTKIMVNLGAPEIAFKTSFLPVEGVGLAREEFIIGEKIKIHPLALCYYKEIRDSKSEIRSKSQIPNSEIQRIIKEIDKLTQGYKNKKQYFIDKLAEGIGVIAAAFYPQKVIVRFSDFKTNEYRQLLGGELFEPTEDNPMLGWRGASRYYDKKFEPAFALECQAIKKVREVFGLKNVSVMIPFCRTVEEGEKVINLMKKYGLKKDKNLKVYVMCEIPSNVILVNEFLKIFDGLSIGSNDLTQLTLGIDRDNAHLSQIGNEENEAVKKMIAQVIKSCLEKNKYCGICGDAPSSLPKFAQFLIKNKIPSISLSPDAVMKTIFFLGRYS